MRLHLGMLETVGLIRQVQRRLQKPIVPTGWNKSYLPARNIDRGARNQNTKR